MHFSCMVICGSLLKSQLSQAPGPAIYGFEYSGAQISIYFSLDKKNFALFLTSLT